MMGNWYLLYGKGINKTGAIWHREAVALFAAPSEFTRSPTGRFLVVGDLWLREQAHLEKILGYKGTPRELVALAWEQWGKDTLNYLQGDFALSLWDEEEQSLSLVRDRTGSRNLYYTDTPQQIAVASSLRLLHPHHARKLNLVALRDYLSCAFVPGEQTLWEQVKELRPGTVITFPHKQVHIYWQITEKIQPLSLETHSHKLRNLLEQVVEKYLPPNSPVGVFLSGGLDSSLITALAQRLHCQKVHTYSLHFGQEYPNELQFSSAVAAHCQSQHHILEIPLRQLWQKLPETMAVLEEPIGDPLTVPNLLLGRLAKESVGVVLNGEGGDPCFGGPKNQPMLLQQLYGKVSQQDTLSAYLLAFQKCAGDLPQLLQPEIWAQVREQPSVFTEDLQSSISYLNRLLVLNMKFKGADQILTKVNNLTHAAGISGRSPLFDPRVVELSMQIPPEYKLSGVEEKAVLKKAVADLLPPGILERPKSGMMVPVQLGFQKYWHREAKSLLLNRRSAIAPYLQQNLIRDWLNYRGDTWRRYGVKLWLLVSLELWLQSF
jgi:asparagine synthase (glutamine-hydrolysing)